jgi:branched-subunit amino acid transport protein
MTATVVLLLAAVVSWTLRVLFITIVPAARLPAAVRDALDDVAPAVMAALVVTSLAHGRGPSGLVTTEVVAALVAGLVAWRTRDLALTVAAGVGTVGVLHLVA